MVGSVNWARYLFEQGALALRVADRAALDFTAFQVRSTHGFGLEIFVAAEHDKFDADGVFEDCLVGVC